MPAIVFHILALLLALLSSAARPTAPVAKPRQSAISGPITAPIALARDALSTSSHAMAPWSGAEFVPGDVDFYIHIDDPGGLRRKRSSFPLIKALQSTVVDDEVMTRWSSVAERFGRSDEQCFADLLGRDIVFTMRQQGGETDWLLITQIDDATLARLVERLNGRQGGGGFVDFPCQGVVAVWRAPSLLISPSRTSPLLLGAITPVQDRAPTLAEHPLVGRAKAWSNSSVQCFIRHPDFIAGTSVIAAAFDDGAASIHHLAKLDRIPLAAEPKDVEPLDTALLSRFEEIAIAGVMRRQCDAPTSALLRTLVPEAKPCDGMRRNAGERWMLLLGAVDGSPHVECQVPAVAIAVEVREPCAGRRQHEAMLRRGVEGYNARYAKAFGGEITPPEVAACADIEDPRQCDLARPLRAASGNHPLVRSCSLHWRAVVGNDGNWQVYASHRAWLDQVTRELEEAEPGDSTSEAAPQLASISSKAAFPAEGFLYGRAAANMLESWNGAAAEFATADPARFREAVSNIASMLRGAACVRWRMSRPEPQLLETQLRVERTRPSTP